MFNKSKKKKISLLMSLGLILSSGFAFVTSSFISKQQEEVINVEAASTFSWGEMDLETYGATFRDVLAGKIKASGSRTIAYKKNNDVLKESDKALNGRGVIPFYHSDKDSTTNFNKEHVWPNSRGVGESGPGADPQMLRPADKSENSARGNYFFGPDGGKQWDPASFGYEPARGEAARIIFYTATRYAQSHGLSLSNNQHDSSSLNTMGTLRYLVEWNNAYPVTAQEIRRNNYLHGQGFARNPFIDHPEWANYIWNENGLRTSKYVDTGDYSLKLDKSMLLLNKGEEKSLTVTLNEASTSTLVWTNTNNDVASLKYTDDLKTVKIEAKEVGTSVVSVYSKAYPTVLARCSIEVRNNGGSVTNPDYISGELNFQGVHLKVDKIEIDGESLLLHRQGFLTHESNKAISSISITGEGVNTLSYLSKKGDVIQNIFYSEKMNLDEADSFEIRNLSESKARINSIVITYKEENNAEPNIPNIDENMSAGCNGSISTSIGLLSVLFIVLIFALIFKFKAKSI